MSEEYSPTELFKKVLKMSERTEYTRKEIERDRVMI